MNEALFPVCGSRGYLHQQHSADQLLGIALSFRIQGT